MFLLSIHEVCYLAVLVTELLLVAICVWSKVFWKVIHMVLLVVVWRIIPISSDVYIICLVFTGPARDLVHAFIFLFTVMVGPITAMHFTLGVSLIVEKTVSIQILTLVIVLRMSEN